MYIISLRESNLQIFNPLMVMFYIENYFTFKKKTYLPWTKTIPSTPEKNILADCL